MTTSIIPSPPKNHTISQQHSYCSLLWRRDQLLVKPAGQVKQPYLPSLAKQQLLVECLKHSPANLVTIDPRLGENWLRFWADACLQAHKPIFLCLPTGRKPLRQNSRFWWRLRWSINWFIALILLLIMSPVILGLLLLMRVYSPKLLCSREWHVGESGKLFLLMKFQDVTLLGYWLGKSGLGNLLLLWNVIKGDISLIGPQYWTLADAVQLTSANQKQLNKLSETPSSWEVEEGSQLLANFRF